jgi:RNA polymerase sigma-70 factor (ECF subfamily)
MLRRHQTNPGHLLAGLYREHATAAYRYAVHLTGSQDDAEDLVQSAFLEAHRFLARGGEIVNARAWLATVIRTRALNLRRDRRETAASDRLETLAGALEHDAGATRAELDRVRAVLYELPEMQHQAFVLRYWSDLSYREIASVLGTTESAVESLLVRARSAIVSGVDVPVECLEVRRLLSADSVTAPAHLRHLGECARCGAARTRLARAAGIAAAAAVVPRIHVAQALAATVPGFTTGAATTSVGVGGTTLAAGKTGMALKAAVAALALAGSATIVHTHGVLHGGAAPPDLRHRPSAHAPTPPSPSGLAATETQPTTVAEGDDSASSPRHRHRDQRGGRRQPAGPAGGAGGGVQAGAPSGGGSDDSQGQDGPTADDPGAIGGAASGGNDDAQSAGSSQDGGASQDRASSENGGGSGQGGSGNDDS